MKKGILNLQARITRLSAAEAEVLITATVANRNPTTELRGKIVGPRCPGATTVEVAYPLRALSESSPSPSADVMLRAVIPEPNLWTETTPFSYDAIVELWQDGVHCDTAKAIIGLKLGAESSSKGD